MTLLRIGNKVVNWDLVACTYLVPEQDRVHIYFQNYQDVPAIMHEPRYSRRPDWILIGEQAKALKKWLESQQPIAVEKVYPSED